MDTNTRRNILFALTFLAGCAVSQVRWLPPALAQSETSIPRWDYYCMRPEMPLNRMDPRDLTPQLQAAGLQGWELVTIDSYRNYCFKRPLR
ncbi:hypothetical protein JQX13_09120 [Archangium violaceum]|uniref:hypothetical protein n=1 Tax=Archangium violaceum TaxID=83451 RepID=UPI00193C5BAC|nr:hypothetical protein [Archangium violaceum]QRK10233.1 hypothetical protein JQX13_09120 [Archangium violaceum]